MTIVIATWVTWKVFDMYMVTGSVLDLMPCQELTRFLVCQYKVKNRPGPLYP